MAYPPCLPPKQQFPTPLVMRPVRCSLGILLSCFPACSYAYPGVWDGLFKDCSWRQGPCISPMTGSDCIVYTCQQSQVLSAAGGWGG